MDTHLFDRFYQIGVIPVLEIDSAERAVPLAEALLMGGLPLAEVTLRTDAAFESIRVMARQAAEVIVGAGTVINLEQAEAARDAGAQFLVSPGMVEDVVIWARENQIPILAGAVTPTEMIRAINLGLNILKFFPAEPMGGLKAIKAISDPFPQLSFIPTGGIRLEKLAEYLQMKRIHAVGCSWMAKRQMIAEGKFDEITRMAKEASKIVRQVGRNHP
ncbi:MAG TPA: bifunctional 4-hydroxy-2-oxoglutarate aldolase/2-dehydro-3-deoxy-phosphogluconate aldolase [Anaerolineales bacterium]|nr:bifunctional 4-hydroxy-2-oxoglutarate aldolase/2-dehydro-3-deoxy-phosphogluconate aldolase [Anaerolineales bacterium]